MIKKSLEKDHKKRLNWNIYFMQHFSKINFIYHKKSEKDKNRCNNILTNIKLVINLNASNENIYKSLNKVNIDKDNIDNSNKINEFNNISNNNSIKQEYEKQKYIFPTKGLINIGSTCYMNSTLQLLLHVNNLINYFLEDYEIIKDTLKKMNKNSSTSGEISEAFYKIVLGVCQNNNDESKNDTSKSKSSKKFRILNLFKSKEEENSFSPKDFKKILGNCNPEFKDFKANDSKDLILYLLQTMHEELNYLEANPPIRLPQPNQENRNSTFNYFSKIYNNQNYSIISRDFYGTYEIKTTCKTCRTTIYNFQKFEYISFGMLKYKKKPFDIMDGFKDNEQPQELKDDNISLSSTKA